MDQLDDLQIHHNRRSCDQLGISEGCGLAEVARKKRYVNIGEVPGPRLDLVILLYSLISTQLIKIIKIFVYYLRDISETRFQRISLPTTNHQF